MADKMKKGSFVTGNNPSIGKGDYAGLPSDVKMEMYPKSKEMMGNYLDDSMNDIDMIQSGSVGRVKSHLSNQK